MSALAVGERGDPQLDNLGRGYVDTGPFAVGEGTSTAPSSTAEDAGRPM